MTGAQAFLPDLLFTDGRFKSGVALIVDDGRIAAIGAPPQGMPTERLSGRAILPGMVNAHSHAFQRAIRGRTEWREIGHESDDFWTWREQMYQAAMALTPAQVHAISRMCFLEMALAGITSVGEFHYLHHQPSGAPYDDVNELAHQVIAAAAEVGLRIALLRVAYARSGYQLPPNPRQVRFIDPSPDAFLHSVSALRDRYADPSAWVGVAPHSVRAVTPEWLTPIQKYAAVHGLPLHMHVAEQKQELVACQAEHGVTPVRLLHDLGLLGPRFTAVHAVHLSEDDRQALRSTGSTICACPTTERNLGDGILDPTVTRIAVGSDSQIQIDLLEDVRELEYHLRLERQERAILAPHLGGRSGLAARLFDSATVNGARAIGSGSGTLEVGESADFFSVDLDDPSIAGAEDALLEAIVFSLERTAIREVAVRGRVIVREGRHAAQGAIVEGFKAAQHPLWGSP